MKVQEPVFILRLWLKNIALIVACRNEIAEQSEELLAVWR